MLQADLFSFCLSFFFFLFSSLHGICVKPGVWGWWIHFPGVLWLLSIALRSLRTGSLALTLQGLTELPQFDFPPWPISFLKVDVANGKRTGSWEEGLPWTSVLGNNGSLAAAALAWLTDCLEATVDAAPSFRGHLLSGTNFQCEAEAFVVSGGWGPGRTEAMPLVG